MRRICRWPGSSTTREFPSQTASYLNLHTIYTHQLFVNTNYLYSKLPHCWKFYPSYLILTVVRNIRPCQLKTCVPEAGIKDRGKQSHPTVSVGCDCLSLHLIPATGSQVLNSLDMKPMRQSYVVCRGLNNPVPLSLTWIRFHPSMNMWLHWSWIVWWQ